VSTAAPARTSLDDLKRVLEGAVDAAIIVDQDCRVLYRNPAYDAYTGRRPREVAELSAQGTPCHNLFNLEICQHSCLMRRAVQAHKPLRMHEVHARRGDGEELTLIVTSTPLGNGLTLETYRDVTAESRVQRKYHALLARERSAKEELERRVYERTASLQQLNETLLSEVVERLRIAGELQKAKVEAERANASKTQFLADASHDLLQPLNAARLFVSALQDRALPVELPPLIGRVDQALSNVEDILNILLDISKLDAGKVAVNIRRVPLNAVLASLRD